jgi:hypothetical protein
MRRAIRYLQAPLCRVKVLSFSTAPQNRSLQLAAPLLAALLIAGLAISPLSVPGKTPDSIHYLDCAQQLLSDGEFGRDYLLWPPLYPALLAGSVELRLDAHWGLLNDALFTFTLFLVIQLMRLLGARLPLAVLAAVAVAFSSPFRFIFGMLWSETLSLPLTLAWLWCWSRYLERQDRARLIQACLCFGLCLLARHAAIPFAGTMIASFAIHNRRHWSWSRLGTLAAAMSLAMLPYLGWLLRTYLLSGTLTGPRTPQLTPLWRLAQGPAASLSHWLLPGVYLPGDDPLAVLASVILLLLPTALTALALVRGSRQESSVASSPAPAGHALALSSLVFLLSYLGFLGIAMELTSLEIPRDRYMAPVFVPLMIVVLFPIVSSRRYARSDRGFIPKVFLVLGALWLMGEVLLP